MAELSPEAELLNPNKPPLEGPQGPQDHLGRGRGKLLQSSEGIDIPVDRPFEYFPSYFDEGISRKGEILSSAQAADEIVRRSDLLGHEFFGPDFELEEGGSVPEDEFGIPIIFPNIPESEVEEEPEEPPDFEAQPGLDFPSEEDEEPAIPPEQPEEPGQEPVEPPAPAPQPPPISGGPGDQGPPEVEVPELPVIPPVFGEEEEPPPEQPTEPPVEDPGSPFLEGEEITEIPATEQAEGYDGVDFVELALDANRYASGAVKAAAIVAGTETVAGTAATTAAAGGSTGVGGIAGLSSTGAGAIVAVAVVIAAGIYGIIQSGKARTRRENVYQTSGGIALSDPTKATHDQLGSGHIWKDQQTGRVFFSTDYEAASLRQKNATGHYIGGRGGATQATELDPETGAIMQGGSFSDGTGYGFGAAGFITNPDGLSNQEMRDRLAAKSTPEAIKARADAATINRALGGTGKDAVVVTPAKAAQYEVKTVTVRGPEGDTFVVNKVQPRAGTAAAAEAARRAQRALDAP